MRSWRERVMPKAHISIHDVAPHTLEPVGRLLATLQDEGVGRVMLLVIPGGAWSEQDLDILRAWVTQGHVLAGHGWEHEATQIDTFYHKVHSRILSRNVAEHLSKTEEELVDLMQRNFEWFSLHDLPSPTHYVPPAWALGSLPRDRLRELPFRTVEVLRGVIEVKSGKLIPMPLLGYEADTWVRAVFLRGFNALNSLLCRFSGWCSRISLHPHDATYRLNHRIFMDCRAFELEAELPSERI